MRAALEVAKISSALRAGLKKFRADFGVVTRFKNFLKKFFERGIDKRKFRKYYTQADSLHSPQEQGSFKNQLAP